MCIYLLALHRSKIAFKWETDHFELFGMLGSVYCVALLARSVTGHRIVTASCYKRTDREQEVNNRVVMKPGARFLMSKV